MTFSLGQYFRANASLTIATPGDLGVSVAVKLRPWTIGHAERREVLGRDSRRVHDVALESSGPVPSRNEDVVAVVVDRERRALGDAGGLDAWNRADAFDGLIVQLLAARIVVADAG